MSQITLVHTKKKSTLQDQQKSEIRFGQFLSLYSCTADHCSASALSFGLLLHHLSAGIGQYGFNPGVGYTTVNPNTSLEHNKISLHLPGKRNPHPPATTEVFKFLLLHWRGKAEAMQDTGCTHLCLIGIQLLQSFIQLHQLLTLG